MSAVEACWYVSVSTDVLQSPLQWSGGPIVDERDLQEVLVNPRALDLLRETSIENGQDELQQQQQPIISQQQQQQQQQQQEEEEEEERDREREHLLSLPPELLFGPQIIQYKLSNLATSNLQRSL